MQRLSYKLDLLLCDLSPFLTSALSISKTKRTLVSLAGGLEIILLLVYRPNLTKLCFEDSTSGGLFNNWVTKQAHLRQHLTRACKHAGRKKGAPAVGTTPA